jgi:hypothetical protein
MRIRTPPLITGNDTARDKLAIIVLSMFGAILLIASIMMAAGGLWLFSLGTFCGAITMILTAFDAYKMLKVTLPQKNKNA